MANIGILGSGAFGTALAMVLEREGHRVYVLGRGISWKRPESLLNTTYHSMEDSFLFWDHLDVLFVAVRSQALREVAFWLKDKIKSPLICASKGIEKETCFLPCQIFEEILPPWIDIGTLSGPCFAKELMKSLPASVVLAGKNQDFISKMASFLHRDSFRIYGSDDVMGVEIGGALKNVVAIVAGACDGLGLGLNARAAIMTRGFGEIVQMGVRLGAKPVTFLGLSGLGDLILTATGDLSRNRRFGYKLAQGQSIESIFEELGEVVEGFDSAQGAYELSQRLSLDTPILEMAYEVFHGQKSIQEAVSHLMHRSQKQEFAWMEVSYGH